MGSVDGLEVDGRVAVFPPLGEGALERQLRALKLKASTTLPKVAGKRLVGSGEGTAQDSGDECEENGEVPRWRRCRRRTGANAVAFIG